MIDTDVNDTDESDTNTVDNSSDVPTPIMDDFGGYRFKVLTRGSGVYASDDITGEITLGLGKLITSLTCPVIKVI